MKTETKNLDKCQVQLTATLEADEASHIVKDVEKLFMREASVPGFRAGKVPLAIIRKNFGSALEQKIREELINKQLAAALKDAKLDETFVAVAAINDVKHDENGATFTATIEVRPTFKLPTYKGLKLTFNDVAVKDEEVEKQLARLRETCANYVDAKEGEAINEGDFVQFDYAGTIDDKPITDVAADAKFFAEGKGFWTQLLEGRFIPEVLEALKGMKIGETKADIKVKFAKDFTVEALRGKKAVYTITVKGFRSRTMPDDAAFLEQLKPQFKENAESLEKLTGYIREQMQKAADSRETSRREQEAADMLLKKVDFDVPDSQVKRGMNAFLKEYAERAQYSGLGAKYFEENREKILKEAEENATKQVRLSYILNAIADAEKIEEPKDENETPRLLKALQFVIDEAKK